MLDFIWWCVIGVIAGWLAKMVVPGREPGGFVATLIIGLIGSLLGGMIARALFGWTDTGTSLLVAFAGSVLLLVLYHAFTKNRSRV